jgi:hypothetical protein
METSGRMVLCGIRAYYAVLRCIEWFLPLGNNYNSFWQICNPSKPDTYFADTREELCFTDEYTLMIHTVCRTRGLEEDSKCAVHWSDVHRSPYYVSDLFEPTVSQFLFIGYRDGNGTVDCTSVLRKYVCFGNLLRLDLLHYLFPDSNGKQWVYLDSTTFKEVDFPSDGMLIGDYDDDEDDEDDEDGYSGDGEDDGNKKND